MNKLEKVDYENNFSEEAYELIIKSLSLSNIAIANDCHKLNCFEMTADTLEVSAELLLKAASIARKQAT
ncbi:hypothetical protein PNIG_a1523 [Pseudoalteromonas nigrifaciens]|uniref:Uncharacterized protein n=1 Tax=Pseudoalteromonas nigrifaciens TaxID=28109 RepID=A0AAC9XX68_9GAMM|nr:hypothetical protein [Pseudoalteromonas nigrifaciens]ASM53672.1 hypothetical protein PNIG_a1523 [Pseudoalteromonas nigrifaciens]GEN40666.1 hypothetical protein PNI02_01320 [Pseudoalteromonas nigrifaciens]SUC52483.1 Uncharacterised protein [Pseudoalteromonas nigrifaciens]